MSKTALFPGTFDPFTKGHEATVHQALTLFDMVVIAVANNPKKQTLFSLEQRIEWVKGCFSNAKIQVIAIDGIVAEYCQQNNISHLIRGIRNTVDFCYEYELAHANKTFYNVETVFLPALPQFVPVSSSIVRELYNHGKDASKYLPDTVKLS